MTRFGVMKHLRILEQAGPGEAALPEPGADPADPRPVDRQVQGAPGVGARGAQARAGGGKRMTTEADTLVSTQVYRVYIKATPQAIWDAITKPEWTERYGYGGRAEYDLRRGGAYRAFSSEAMKKAGAEMGVPTPDIIADGEVIEADPPNRLRP